jgi:hypothetical protein
MVAKAPSPLGGRLRPQQGEKIIIPSAYIDSEGNPLPDVEFALADLSFVEKHELLARLATTLDELIMQGVNLLGMLESVGIHLDDPDSLKQFAGKVRSDGIEMFTREILQIAMRLVAMSPGLLEDIFLICLKVNPIEYEYHRQTVRQMDDQQGFYLLQRIIEVNREHFVDFISRYGKFFEPLTQKLSEPSKDSEEAATEASDDESSTASTD